MSSMTSNGFGKWSLVGQITDTVQPVRWRAWASCQTRRSKGTGKFSTTMTHERGCDGGMDDLRLSGFRGFRWRRRLCRLRRGVLASALPAESPADADVAKPMRLHCFDRINIAQVDHDRRGQTGFDPSEVESAKLVPFGDDDRRVRALEASIGVLRKLDSGKQWFCGSNALRVICDNACARCLQFGQDDEARRVAHVVSFGLVCEPEDGDPLASD